MTDTPIVARPGSSAFPFALLCLGGGLLVFGLVLPVPTLTYSAIPLLIFGPILLATRRPRVEFFLTENGIDVLAPKSEFIPYERIDAVSVAGSVRPRRDRSFDMLVSHGADPLFIPAHIDADCSEVYAFLRERMPESESSVPATLREHYDRQVSKFDPGRVFAFRARKRFDPPRSGRALWVAVGFIILGFAWLFSTLAIEGPQANHRKDTVAPVFVGLGGFSLLGGLIATLIVIVRSRGTRGRRGTDWQGAGLVMSPLGLALKTKTLSGKMRWEEITAIQWLRQGVTVKVSFPGSQIIVEDVFDEPITKLYDLMWAFWRPPESSAPDRRFQDDY